MAKILKDSFSYFGSDFQVRLVAQLIADTKFAESIIEIIDPNYFEDHSLKLIILTIKEAYQKHNVIPDISSLEIRLADAVMTEFQKTYTVGQLEKIKQANLNDGFLIQEKAMKFCKQEELKKSIKEIQLIIDKGDISRYDECEEILKKALIHGENKDNGLNVLDNIDSVLEDDFRKPIPTGIKGLDEVMDGGLSKGELALIVAPFGVGKTTMITKIANTAKDLGKNVLQIFFEDTPKIIQRKHLSCWSGYELNSLSLHKDELKALIEKKKAEPGVLKLKKFPSDGTTVPIIRQYIRKLIGSGFRPDVLLVDYIDCIQPSKNFDDVYAGEGSVMRQFETLLFEFNIAGWTAVQGNRSSIKSEVVEADQIGGSIKKGQIGHFIVSIAKSLDQKENGTATMAILKSRFGKDGIVFSDIKFDNARIQIDMNQDNVGMTRTEHRKEQQKDENEYVASLMKKRSEAINATNTENNTVSQ